MFRFIVGMILLVVFLVGILPVRAMAKRRLTGLQADSGNNRQAVSDTKTTLSVLHSASWGAVALGMLLILWSTIRIVPANNVGIPTNFGSIGSPMSAGIHLTEPWTQVHKFSTRVQELSMLAAPDEGDKEKNDSIEIIAKGGGSMNVDLTVRYFVQRDNADVLFRQAGTMTLIKDRFVRPDAREVTRNVFSQYTAEEGYSTKRGEISTKIFEDLGPRLLPRGILVDSVNVRDVAPETQVLSAINGILQTRNDALKAAEDQRKQVTEAETRKQVAERDKDATVTKAQADAQAVTIAADAQAAANAKIAASLTPSLTSIKVAEACRDAIAQTKATVVNVCTGESSGSSSVPGVIVDARK